MPKDKDNWPLWTVMCAQSLQFHSRYFYLTLSRECGLDKGDGLFGLVSDSGRTKCLFNVHILANRKASIGVLEYCGNGVIIYVGHGVT